MSMWVRALNDPLQQDGGLPGRTARNVHSMILYLAFAEVSLFDMTLFAAENHAEPSVPLNCKGLQRILTLAKGKEGR